MPDLNSMGASEKAEVAIAAKAVAAMRVLDSVVMGILRMSDK
jgi:hypothetical protein